MLHNDNALFEQVVLRVSEDTGIAASIIEKDYYVTLFLQRIVERQPNIIFKGGTSLSKCYKLINRFSEDIDLNVDTETHPTEGQRKKLKESIVSIIAEFGFTLTNPDKVRSRRDYNRYIVDYPTIFHTGYLKEHLIVETAVYIKAYPCKRMLASSLIYDYLEHNGYRDMVEKYGLQPFELNGQTDEVPKALFDGTQTPVYWEYYETDPEAYRNIFARLMKAAGKVIFAGNLHKEMGVAPDNGLSQRTMDVAFSVAKEFGVTDILMTTWGDHGNECPFYAIMSSFWYAVHKLYPCPADLDAMVSAYTGYTCAQWQIADEINYIVRIGKKICNASIWALHNDLLIGMMDCHIPEDADEHYRKLYSRLLPLSQENSQFAYIFRFYTALCDVMARKTTFSKRLRRAYMAGDRQTMREMQKELPELQQKIEEFRRVFRILWMKDNKGFGFEVMDLRFGGMAARCQTAHDVLEDYLEGKIQHIYELEEERLPYWADALEKEHTYAPWFFHWSKSFTENDIL